MQVGDAVVVPDATRIGSELGAADPIGMPFPAVGGRAVDRVPLVRLDAESRAEHVRLAAIRSLAWRSRGPRTRSSR